MKLYKLFALFSTLVLLASTLSALPAAAASSPSGAVIRTVKKGVSVKPGDGKYTKWKPGTGYTNEFFGGDSGNHSPARPNLQPNRSLSFGKNGPVGPSIDATPRLGPDPKLTKSFEGLNLFQQRWAAGGNQFSVEPPDQGLCASPNYVVEVVNDVVNIFNAYTGKSVLPANDVGGAVDLNTFYGYHVAIDRTHGVFGPSLTDPSCVYDTASGRFFMVVLTLDTNPSSGDLTLTNHLDLAVSQSSDPTQDWNVYSLDVTNDGTNPASSNACPCLGDYPHIGLDANGVYLTTNSYPWNGSGFDGAQIYAFPKAKLVAGAPTIHIAAINTWNMVNAPSDAGSKQPGFTVWPAQAAGGMNNTANGGTEYFVSSNAADEATHPVAGAGGIYKSNKLVLWTLTNTSALNTFNPLAVVLTNKLVGVNPYSLPPKSQQPNTGSPLNTSAPLGYCANNTTTKLYDSSLGCWQFLAGSVPVIQEVGPYLDSNDTRIQQVTYANGFLWTALDTSVTPTGSMSPRAGIEWFMLNPTVGTAPAQGYVGSPSMDFIYPSIGITQAGKGIIAFTATGNSTYPSAAYAPVDAGHGVTSWSVAGAGATFNDGFTGYNATDGTPIRPRWGDYGATVVVGNSIWFASEYIASACNYTTWGGDNFFGGSGTGGICGGTRAFYGNWSTRVSKYVP